MNWLISQYVINMLLQLCSTPWNAPHECVAVMHIITLEELL